MLQLISKTFGGLSKQYYFRHFFFGILIMLFYLGIGISAQQTLPIQIFLFFGVNTVLYPYSRFVYESIVGFVVGNNVFIGSAFFMLFVKIITMVICWAGSLFIAPFGLAYLFYHHSKNSR